MRKPIARLIAACSTLAIGALVLAPQALATDVTDTVLVSATVIANCTIDAEPLAFGNYTNGEVDAATTIAVTCSVDTPWVLALDAGDGTGATVANRKMQGPVGGSELSYSIFSNALRTTVWGNTAGTNTVAGDGTGAPETVDVYGRIVAGQFVAAGAYSDSVTATLTY